MGCEWEEGSIVGRELHFLCFYLFPVKMGLVHGISCVCTYDRLYINV